MGGCRGSKKVICVYCTKEAIGNGNSLCKRHHKALLKNIDLDMMGQPVKVQALATKFKPVSTFSRLMQYPEAKASFDKGYKKFSEEEEKLARGLKK